MREEERLARDGEYDGVIDEEDEGDKEDEGDEDDQFEQ